MRWLKQVTERVRISVKRNMMIKKENKSTFVKKKTKKNLHMQFNKAKNSRSHLNRIKFKSSVWTAFGFTQRRIYSVYTTRLWLTYVLHINFYSSFHTCHMNWWCVSLSRPIRIFNFTLKTHWKEWKKEMGGVEREMNEKRNRMYGRVCVCVCALTVWSKIIIHLFVYEQMSTGTHFELNVWQTINNSHSIVYFFWWNNLWVRFPYTYVYMQCRVQIIWLWVEL